MFNIGQIRCFNALEFVHGLQSLHRLNGVHRSEARSRVFRQILETALFREPALIEYKNSVRILQRAHAMRDDEHRAGTVKRAWCIASWKLAGCSVKFRYGKLNLFASAGRSARKLT